jgi:hypothetical protein
MLNWLLATIKRRAVCAERCTYGSERRGREIVRLRSASYSTMVWFTMDLPGGRNGPVRTAGCWLGAIG